jgi:hypothetical protein
MTGIASGKPWSRIGPEVAPTLSSASGVWTLQEYSENKGAGTWPNPTLGHWAFVGDPDSSGSPADYYSEGGFFQTAAQASAGNNEYTLIARVTGSTGITGSGVAVIQGIRINGNAPLSGTVSYNKGFWWQYSDGVTLNGMGDVWHEDSSGNFYLVFHGYVGGTYNPPRTYSRVVKLNSSMVVQWSQAYGNNPSLNDGVGYPTIAEINGDLVLTTSCYVAQNGNKPLMQIAEINAANGNMASQARINGAGFSYSADQVQPSQTIVKNKLDAGGSNIGFICVRRYLDNTPGFPGGGYTMPNNAQVVSLMQITYNSSSFSYTSLDNTWYNKSGSGANSDLNPADFEVKNNSNKTFLAANGAGQSIVDSSTKNFVMFGVYEIGTSEGSSAAWILKCQSNGRNENMYVSGMVMDYANSCFYLHGSCTNIGAANAALASLWIGKFPCSTDGVPTGAISWINSYCSESWGVYPKTGRNGLKLTANNTITSFGYTQTTSGSGTPAILYLVTVPVDGSAKGGSGSVDGISVTSHDISSFVLFQYHTVSTNTTVGFSTSGTANMSLNTSFSYLNTPTAGTQYDTVLVPNPTEYKSGGV